MRDVFAQQSEAFLAWLKSENVEISPKVELADLRRQHAGRSLADIGEDEDLFNVSRNTILSQETSELAQLLPEPFADESYNTWLLTILVMIYEYQRGPQSRWAPYLALLLEEFDTLMFWSKEELDQLQASAVRHKVGKEGADETFRKRILPIVEGNKALFAAYNLADVDILALAHRMGSIMVAYAFDLERDPSQHQKQPDEEGYATDEEDEELPKAMIPLADMLNADATRNNARLYYGSSSVCMKALKPIQAGEEIFNDYGPLPRADLLRRYGYITDNYKQYDIVELSRDMLTKVLVECTDMSQDQIDARVAKYEDDLEDGYDLTWDDDSTSPEHPAAFLKLIGKSLTQDVLDAVLARAIEQRLAEYPTSVDEDQTLIQELAPQLDYHRADSKGLRRKLMAIQIRIGEKQLLVHVGDRLRRGTKRRLSSSPPTSSAKKLR
ncbi:Ribosomal lysine N-methyltransferase 4 [Elasticomyces elasticus]|nr:Ribosomal lysine N-methyltransferase 4 [Elasticomyces elasticus]